MAHSDSLPRHFSNSNRKVMETNANAPSKRVYRVWKGSNRFFLGGRLIFGPDVRSMVITIFLIVIPVLLFAVFVSQRLVNEFKNHFGNLIVTIAIVFVAYIIAVLFLTSGRDPGIIPRNTHPPEPQYDGEGSNLSADWAGVPGAVPSLPAIKDVVVNGVTVKVKYCHTCMLYRPPRCSHCSICNNCVERFDHHCPWVGQCIGKTTYENFRYRYDGKLKRPYDRGCLQNVKEIFFSKIPKSQNNFRARVKEDVPPFSSSHSFGQSMSIDMPKPSIDLEMDGKRRAVAAEEFDDIQSQIESVGGLGRCGTLPHDSNWEITPDIEAVAAEFGMEHASSKREKIEGNI